MLGKNQRFILNALEERGEPERVLDLAWEIHNRDVDEKEGERPTHPPRSVKTSMRRSAHSLEDRGLVETGYKSEGILEERKNLLWCWLPEHDPPRKVIERLSQDEVRSVVWDVIQKFQDLPENEWEEEWNFYMSWDHVPTTTQIDERFVPHKHVLSEGMKRLNPRQPFHEGRKYVAVWRAIRGLEEDGEIYIRRSGATAWAIVVL